MTDKVLKTISRYNMIEQGDRILVALSGGADSVALLSIMQSLSTLEEVDGLRSLVEKEMGLTETKMMKLLECPCG